jgi:hypothetical protein
MIKVSIYHNTRITATFNGWQTGDPVSLAGSFEVEPIDGPGQTLRAPATNSLLRLAFDWGNGESGDKVSVPYPDRIRSTSVGDAIIIEYPVNWCIDPKVFVILDRGFKELKLTPFGCLTAVAV